MGPASAVRGSTHCLVREAVKVSKHSKNFICNTIVNDWNALTESTIDAILTVVFKKGIDNFFS